MPSLSLSAANAKSATTSAATTQRRGRDFHTESNAEAAGPRAVHFARHGAAEVALEVGATPIAGLQRVADA